MNYSVIFLSIFAFILPLVSSAVPQDDERKQFFKEIREYKHKFIARELELSKDQEQKFFPLYDQMEEETHKISTETRDLENKVREADNVSEIEYEKATDALFELKIREGEIEKSYLEQFRTVLDDKQLFNLKNAERNFNRDLMQHRNRLLQKKAKNQ